MRKALVDLQTSAMRRLQLHWEWATKAIHQIPRSKTTLLECLQLIVCKVVPIMAGIDEFQP